MPELDEKKRIIDYDTVNDPDENYYALIDNGTAGTGKVSIKGLGPANMISDAYSDQDTYAVGDVCIYNNILYVCNTEIDTPHAFDLSEWDPDTLGNYCSKLNGDVTEINSSLSQLKIHHDTLSGTTDNSGRLFSNYDISNKLIIALLPTEHGKIADQVRLSGNTLCIKYLNSDSMSPFNNQSVTCNFYYVSADLIVEDN